MHTSKINSILFFIVALLSLTVPLFMNCSKTVLEDAEQQSLISCGTDLPLTLRNPQTIDEAMNLVNALPKPLDISCFLSSLKPPLKVFAVNSFFSAQPSGGQDSPRIFIINNNLIMSVVPAGSGKNLMEFAEVVSPGSSVKGEIEFPIESEAPPDMPYSRIYNGSSGTSCLFCHRLEKPYPKITTGLAFESEIIFPDQSDRITQRYLKYQSQNCSVSTDAHRCNMLKAIFLNGQAVEGEFPR